MAKMKYNQLLDKLKERLQTIRTHHRNSCDPEMKQQLYGRYKEIENTIDMINQLYPPPPPLDPTKGTICEDAHDVDY